MTTPTTELDIYLAGKRTLDARNRSEIQQKKFLAGVCVLSLLANGVQAYENLRNSAHSRLIPYVVQTDTQGRIINTEILKDRSVDENFSSQKTIKAEIANWVQDWRTVTNDLYAQKALAVKVFNMVDGQGEASPWLLNWYRAHDPVERSRKAHVEVMVKTIVPQSDSTYEVYWEEKEVNPTDSTTVVSRWRSVILISINPPKNESDVIKNRFGLYVERVSDPQKEAMNE